MVLNINGNSLTLSLPESNLESINVFLTFKYVDKTLVCDHSNESYGDVLSYSAVWLTNLQNEIQDYFLSFELSTLGSERVLYSTFSIRYIQFRHQHAPCMICDLNQNIGAFHTICIHLLMKKLNCSTNRSIFIT